MQKKVLEKHVNETFAPEMLEIATKKDLIENVTDYGKVIFSLALDYDTLIRNAEDETVKTGHIAQFYRLVNIVTRFGLMNDIY